MSRIYKKGVCGSRRKNHKTHGIVKTPLRTVTKGFRRIRALGSSLVVSPANDMPRVALRSGARLVIINQGETPMDRSCHLRFEERTGEVLPRAVKKLKELMKN